MLLVTNVVSIGNDHAHKFYKLAKRRFIRRQWTIGTSCLSLELESG